MPLAGIRAGSAIPSIFPSTPQETTPVAETATTFAQLLNQALTSVDQAQRQAEAQSIAFATGENRDVAELMIATERAQLALDLTLQIRNKVLEAYQEIVRMQL